MNQTDSQPDSRDENKIPKKKQLTIDRTILAQERTLMAWVRTAASFMTFGFALYKILSDRMHETTDHPILDLITPIRIAIILFTTGLVGLLLATIRHIQTIALLNKYQQKKYFSLPLVLAYVIMTLLVFMLVGAFISRQ